MKELPILFSTPMVQAILAGRKTQTRRVANPQISDDAYEINLWAPPDWRKHTHAERGIYYWNESGLIRYPKLPYGLPGDILWVRETFFDCSKFKSAPLFSEGPTIYYKADGSFIGDHRWKPSIHMPKAAARIWLQVESIRIERLHAITDEDSVKEGIEQNKGGLLFWKDYLKPGGFNGPRNSFMSLWQSINGNWNTNPWVWVITFKVLSTTGRPTELKPAGS